MLLDTTAAWVIALLRSQLEPGCTALSVMAAEAEEQYQTIVPSAPSIRQLRQLGLSEPEIQIVLTIAVAASDSSIATSLATLDPRPLRALQRFIYGRVPTSEAFDHLGEHGRLRQLGVVHVAETPAGTGLVGEVVRLSERVVGFLSGCPSVRLPRCARLSSSRPNVIVRAPEQCVASVRDAMVGGARVVTIVGAPGTGRRTLLASVARDAGRSLLEIDARKLPGTPKLAAELRDLALACKLHGHVPLFANLDALADEKNERLELLASEIAPLFDGLILATCGVQRPSIQWDRPTIVVEMGRPSTVQLAALWHEQLGQGTGRDAQLLAERYPLAPALIHHAAEAAKARAGSRPLEPEDVYGGIRAVLDDRLGKYARRVTVTQTWKDLVIPEDHVEAIIELMARVRSRTTVYEQWGFADKVGRGLGVSALFSGPPGTGKTMVAALIARELGLELYQVDMAKIVSKYIGETEKNLGALFDAAEAGHAILLFDEADALFGKRTDVKSSNDRYANLETNYLLQRLETYTGICLLTSNHESHIDPAFQRRLSLHLRFPIPDEDERAQLWRAVLPDAAPISENVDFARLARRFSMTGGYIRNAALRAAFVAADEGVAITEAHLV